MENNEQIIFAPETTIKIGAITYIVAAHFDDKRENLKTKINRLLCSEVNHLISKHMYGLSQSDVV